MRVSDRNPWPFVVSLILALGCSQQRPHIDERYIYEAVLSDSSQKGAFDELAIEPHFLSDSGTFTRAGMIADSVTKYLRERRLVSEVCAPDLSSSSVPDCVPERARTAVRLSAPQVGVGDTVTVFVAHWHVRPKSDTASLFLPFAMSQECRLVLAGANWRVTNCRLRMIT